MLSLTCLIFPLNLFSNTPVDYKELPPTRSLGFLKSSLFLKRYRKNIKLLIYSHFLQRPKVLKDVKYKSLVYINELHIRTIK